MPRAGLGSSDVVAATKAGVDGDRARESGTAEVITWARGSTMLPAAGTPKALVRPLASTGTKPVALTPQPRSASRPTGCDRLPGRMNHYAQ